MKALFGPDPSARAVSGTYCVCGASTRENLLVQPLSVSQWRLIARAVPWTDTRGLLGSIEEDNQQFEVMRVRHGVHAHRSLVD